MHHCNSNSSSREPESREKSCDKLKASEMSTNEKLLACEIQNVTRNESGKKTRLDDVSICIYEIEKEMLK